MNTRKILTIIIVIGVVVLGISLVVVLANETDQPVVPLETREEFFVDIDGDGDLDYVHFVQFIRQENEEADPYPAPQPGQ